MKIGGLKTRRKKYTCRCDLCSTTRKFKRIVSKLPDKERDWMNRYYECSFEQSAELDMALAYLDSIKK